MILIAGGTGTLGTQLVATLLAGGTPVRVLTRDPDRARHLDPAVQVVVGDVRDASTLVPAMHDVDLVVSAVQGFAGVDPGGPDAVDVRGNTHLAAAARTAGVRRFVLVSAVGAAPDAQLSLRRAKHAAEQSIQDSGLEWTVVRPTVYLETWLGILRGMLTDKGAITLFGRGRNPITFISVQDVAALIAQTAGAPDLAGAILEIGGPENLTLEDLAAAVLAGHRGGPPVRHVPLPVLRLAATLLRPVAPTFATLAQFGIVMDTTDMTLPADTARARVPGLPETRLAELLATPANTANAREERPPAP